MSAFRIRDSIVKNCNSSAAGNAAKNQRAGSTGSSGPASSVGSGGDAALAKAQQAQPPPPPSSLAGAAASWTNVAVTAGQPSPTPYLEHQTPHFQQEFPKLADEDPGRGPGSQAAKGPGGPRDSQFGMSFRPQSESY